MEIVFLINLMPICITLKGLCEKISIFYGEVYVWDHRESENSTLHAIWTLLMVEISIFPSSFRVSYSIRGSQYNFRTCTIASVRVQQRPCVYNDDHVLNLVGDFQRLFCRFRKWVLVNNKNKLDAELDNYIRILCTNNVHFYYLCLDFIAGVLFL